MIALITPTGYRSKQIDLCAKWMRRQTYQGDVLWVIVDDVIPSTTDFILPDFKKNWEIKKVYPRPAWVFGDNTQSRNIQAGLDVVKQYPEVKSIYIIEDDDYYFPTYLEEMEKKLVGVFAAAEINTIYFNVNTISPIYNKNTTHGSLFQTAFKPALIPILEYILYIPINRFIDMQFWSKLQFIKTNLFKAEKVLSIGIKGLPGRPGIGMGHIQERINIPTGDIKAEKIKALKALIGLDYLLYL